MQTEAQAFDALVDEFFQGWRRYHPEAIHHQPNSLAALQLVDDDDIQALHSWLESLLMGLDEIDAAQLDQQRRTEFFWLGDYAQIERQSLCGKDWRLHDPLSWVERLVLGMGMSVASRGSDIDRQALALLPDFVRHASGLLGTAEPVKYYCLQAAQNQLAVLLCELRHAHVARGAQKQVSDRDDLLQEAIRALESFADFLKGLSARKTEINWRITTDYEQILRQRYGIQRSLPWLEEWLGKCIANVEQALKVASKKVSRQVAITTNTKRRLTESCSAAHQFILIEALFDVSKMSDIILSTASRCRPSFSTVEYFRQQSTPAHLYLLPPEEGLSSVQINSMAYRYVWPGHHLMVQFHADSEVAQRPVRRYLNSQAWAMCWQLYAEELIIDAGVSSDVASVVELLQNRLQQLTLARAELELNQGASIEKTRNQLISTSGLPKQLLAENWVSVMRHPGRQLAAVYWWALLQTSMRVMLSSAQVKSIKNFHSQLLEAGPVPLPWLLSEVFGEKALQNIEEQMLP